MTTRVRFPSSTLSAIAPLALAALATACSVDVTSVSPDASAFDAGLPDTGTDAAAPFDGAADATLDAADASAPFDASTTADAAADAADAKVSLDPAPTFTTPGKYTGAGCPDTSSYDSSGYVVSLADAGTATTETFTGTVTGNTGNGTYFVRGPDGEEIQGPVPTAGDGSYDFTLPMFCGANLVKLVWPSASCNLVVVLSVQRTACAPADIQATISWDNVGSDWELHLIKPGGHINDNATDCTWTSCVNESPDWGVQGDPTDDPHKDVDDTGYYGPENIYLNKPENGTYTLMVEHWGGGDASDGQLIVNVQGATTIIPRKALVSQHVWKAATITWPGKVVTPFQDDVDCSGNWSSGCRLSIP